MNVVSRILVVDDDGAMRTSIVDVLQNAGFANVMQARDGEQARRLLEAPDHVVLLVTAIDLHPVSGIDIAQSAKRRHPGIKIIFVSGTQGRFNALPFAYRHLRTPFTMSDLVTAVADVGVRSFA